MKVLLDACVWGGAQHALRAVTHDVVWAGDWEENPSDAELLSRAHSEGRVLITLDKDFGELAVLFGAKHCGIVRLVNISARRQAEACLYVIQKYSSDLAAGAIITAEPGRVRIRPAPREESHET